MKLFDIKYIHSAGQNGLAASTASIVVSQLLYQIGGVTKVHRPLFIKLSYYDALGGVNYMYSRFIDDLTLTDAWNNPGNVLHTIAHNSNIMRKSSDVDPNDLSQLYANVLTPFTLPLIDPPAVGFGVVADFYSVVRTTDGVYATPLTYNYK